MTDTAHADRRDKSSYRSALRPGKGRSLKKGGALSRLKVRARGFPRIADDGGDKEDMASFVGWSPQPSAVGPVPHQPGFFIVL